MNDDLTKLEEISRKIDNVISAAAMGASAFSHKDAYTTLAPEDVSGMFTVIQDNLKAANDELLKTITEMYRNNK